MIHNVKIKTQERIGPGMRVQNIPILDLDCFRLRRLFTEEGSILYEHFSEKELKGLAF
jgi:hypothetical protein